MLMLNNTTVLQALEKFVQEQRKLGTTVYAACIEPRVEQVP